MKGYEKKVFFLKNTGSSIFEEAIFLVRGDGAVSFGGEGDMIAEANRIIEQSLAKTDSGSKGAGKKILLKFLTPFFLGALVGTVVSLLCAFIF